VLLARTDAKRRHLTTDVDENDKPFLTGERTSEDFYKTRRARPGTLPGLAYAEYADMGVVRDRHAGPRLREEIRRGHPQALSREDAPYNCSRSFN